MFCCELNWQSAERSRTGERGFSIKTGEIHRVTNTAYHFSAIKRRSTGKADVFVSEGLERIN